MSRFLSALLALTFLFSLSACGLQCPGSCAAKLVYSRGSEVNATVKSERYILR